MELEAANHRGGKREKKNLQGGEEGEGGGNNFMEASLELQPSVGGLSLRVYICVYRVHIV